MLPIPVYVARRVSRHLLDLVLYRRGMQLVNGGALIARLLKSASDLGVELWVSSPAKRLLANKGVVQGAVIGTPNGDVTIRARRATILASGGFPNDIDRRREMFPRTPTGKEHWSLAPESTSGDGLRLGEAVGGQVDRSLASPVAWALVSLVPHRDESVGHFPHIIDRAKPGSLEFWRTDVASSMRLTAITTTWRRWCGPSRKVRKWRPGLSALMLPSVAIHWVLPSRRRAACALPALRLPQERAYDRGVGARLRRRSCRPQAYDRRIQSGRPEWRGPLSSAAARRPITAMEAIPIRSPIPASRRSSTALLRSQGSAR